MCGVEKIDMAEHEKKLKVELDKPQNHFQIAISQGNSSELLAITFADLLPPTSYLASIGNTIAGFVYDESTIAVNHSLKLGVDQMQIMANNLVKLSSQKIGSRFLEKSNLLFCDVMINYGAGFLIKRWIDAQVGLYIASFLRQFTDSATYVKIIHKLITGGVSDAFAEGVLIESGYDMIKYIPNFIESPIAKHLIAKPQLMLASATSTEAGTLISALEKIHKKYEQAKSSVTTTMVSGIKKIYESDLVPGSAGSSIREGIKGYSSALGSELGLLTANRILNRYAGENQKNAMLESIDAYFPTSRPDSQQKLENRDLLGQHYSMVFNQIEETSKRYLVHKTVKELKKQISPEFMSLFETYVDTPIREALNSISIPESIIEKILKNHPLSEEDYYKIQCEKHFETTVKAAQLTSATWRLGTSLASAFTGKITEKVTALRHNAYTKTEQEEMAVKLIDDIQLYIATTEDVDIFFRIKEAVQYFSIDQNIQEPTEKNKHFLAKLYQENESGLLVSLIDSLVEKNNASIWLSSFFTAEKEQTPEALENKKAKSIACIQLLLHFGVDPSVVVKKMSPDYSNSPQAGVNAIQVAISDIQDEQLLNNLINLFLKYNCNFLVPTKLDSETALSIACYKNKVEVVKTLLTRLSQNDKLMLCSMKNRYGMSAIDHATYQSNKEVVQLLLAETALSLMGSNALQTLQLAGIAFVSENMTMDNLTPLVTYPKIEDFNSVHETSRRMMIGNLLEANPDMLTVTLNNSLYLTYLIGNNNIKDVQYIEYLTQKMPQLKCLSSPDEKNAYHFLKNALLLGTNDSLFDKIFSEIQAFHAGAPKNLIRWHNAVELLNIAIEKENVNAITKLLEMNPSLANCTLNSHKDTPLHIILKSNMPNRDQIIQLFINKGASIFLQNEEGNSVLDEQDRLHITSEVLNSLKSNLLLAYTNLSPELQTYSKFIVINHIVLSDSIDITHFKSLISTFTEEEKTHFKQSIGLEILKNVITKQKPENVLLVTSNLLPELLPLESLAPWQLLHLTLNSDNKVNLLEISTLLIENHLTSIGFESSECLNLLQKYIEIKPENIELVIEKALEHSEQKNNRIADILKWLYIQSNYLTIKTIIEKYPNSIHFKPTDNSQTFAETWQASWTMNIQEAAKDIQKIITNNEAPPVFIHAQSLSSSDKISSGSKPPVLFTQPSMPKRKASEYEEDRYKQEVNDFLIKVKKIYPNERDNPEYAGILAIFQTPNQKQLDKVIANTPPSELRDEAVAIKLTDPNFNKEQQNTLRPST